MHVATSIRLALASLLLAWLLTCLLALTARAQSDAAVAPGARVRLTWSEGERSRRAIGELVAEDDGVLLLRPDRSPDTLRVPRSTLRSVEVSRGTAVMRGVGRGVLIGGALGAVVGLALGEDCSDNEFLCFDRSDTALLGGLVGAAAGAGVGALIGSHERWQSATLAPRLTVVPARGGVSIRARITI